MVVLSLFQPVSTKIKKTNIKTPSGGIKPQIPLEMQWLKNVFDESKDKDASKIWKAAFLQGYSDQG